MSAPTGGPWTRHGHDIPDVTVAGAGRPAAVARCGGPALCRQCREDVEEQDRHQTVEERAADIRDRTDPLALTAELERLHARVAELEAGEVRIEWGLRWPEPDGKVRFTGSEEQVRSPHTEHWRDGGAVIVQREIREHVGQWTAVSS